MSQVSEEPAAVPCKYRTGKTLGRGSFSVVKEAIHLETGEVFACKVINKRLMEGRQKMVRNEVEILKIVSSRHANIVTLHDYFETRNNVCLCFDLCTGGELLKVILEKGKYYERDAAQLMRKVFDGVSYIHNAGIVHRDLKPDNLLFKDGEIMIADFGLSRFMDEDKPQVLTEVCGTPGYMAPEVYRKRCHDPGADIWSLGVITYFVLAGYIPFDRAETDQEMESVLSGDYTFEPSQSWESVTGLAKGFISSCLIRNHTHRPSATQLLDHPWLSDNTRETSVQSDKSFDLLPLVKEASCEKRTSRSSNSSNPLVHRFTAP
ncbi:kinase-like domain-containing protein [Pterulicium gracile]|uniref:Kinase-like domain-containing protein n=1 Tax=Pterulicium gracile TaxID=1884261 RepID=A0A5C3Q710_9AGAR|nr:kinase-like domain-containing protein [Pterula gracilis]